MLSKTRKQRNHEGLGTLLAKYRADEGYTQKALADALAIEYYTMISQMELGYISIPVSLWVPIADKLRLNRAEWVLKCLLEYQPELYAALFGVKSSNEVAELLNKLEKGVE